MEIDRMAQFQNQLRQRACLFVVMVSLALVSGCGPSGPEIARVSGVVTLDSKPLPEAFVFFRHADGGRISEAFTNDKGEYKLNYSLEESGAMVGTNTVRISTFIEAVKEDSGAIVKGTNKKELVPPKYNKQSELTAEVKSGNNILNFDLKSK
jgi:hypothetical protein